MKESLTSFAITSAICVMLRLIVLFITFLASHRLVLITELVSVAVNNNLPPAVGFFIAPYVTMLVALLVLCYEICKCLLSRNRHDIT